MQRKIPAVLNGFKDPVGIVILDLKHPIAEDKVLGNIALIPQVNALTNEVVAFSVVPAALLATRRINDQESST